MNVIDTFILGLVEGVTEFLPISSTGHLILAGKVLGLPESEFLKTFDIAIQLGAILAVIVLYARSLLVNVEILKRVAAAFVPTAVIGFVLYKLIKKFLLANSGVVLWSLFLGGIFLVVFERVYRERNAARGDLARMSYRDAVLIGLFQSLAVVPGVSRSAATIVGGLILGMTRRAVVEFSFLLAVPTMLAATAWDLLKTSQDITLGPREWQMLGLGFVTAFAVAIVSIKFLLHFIQRHNFMSFGIYRICVAVLFWAVFAYGGG